MAEKISEILAEAKKHNVPIKITWTEKSMTINGKWMKLKATDLTVWNGNYDKACTYWNNIAKAVGTPEYEAFEKEINAKLAMHDTLRIPKLEGRYGGDWSDHIQAQHYDDIRTRLERDIVRLQAWSEQLAMHEDDIRTKAVLTKLNDHHAIDRGVKEETNWQPLGEKVA